MQRAYGKLSEKTLEPAPSAGVRLATHSDVTDILSLVLFLYLNVTVWLKEREQNMLLLLRTAKNGRIRLALCKLTVLVSSCMGAGILLYGSNMVTAGILYDFGDLSRPLASVYEYGHTLWEISVGEFIILNVMLKILSYIFIMLLLGVICLCVHSSIAAFAGIIAVSTAGCLMYYKIPALLYLSNFRQVMVSYEVGRTVLGYPVNSLPHLEAFGTGMSLGTYYIVIYVLRLMAAVMGMFFICRMSKWIKSQAYTMLVGVVVLMLPVLIVLYNRRLICAAYPHSLFAGNLFVQEKAAAIVCIVTWVLFFVLEGTAAAVIRRKKR